MEVLLNKHETLLRNINDLTFQYSQVKEKKLKTTFKIQIIFLHYQLKTIQSKIAQYNL